MKKQTTNENIEIYIEALFVLFIILSIISYNQHRDISMIEIKQFNDRAQLNRLEMRVSELEEANADDDILIDRMEQCMEDLPGSGDILNDWRKHFVENLDYYMACIFEEER